MATRSTNLANLLLIIGGFFLVASLSIFTATYLPLAKQEIVYELSQRRSPTTEAVPVNTDFGIVIKKIGANSSVVANVDPFNANDYQSALSRGVAHAKGSALPGQPGNIFLFSHSSADFLTATRYNSIFYLLDKLSPGDQVDLYYLGRRFTYELKQKRLVDASDISYLQPGDKEQLTLMTCWPPGTSLKRLIWQAEPVRIQ